MKGDIVSSKLKASASKPASPTNRLLKVLNYGNFGGIDLQREPLDKHSRDKI